MQTEMEPFAVPVLSAAQMREILAQALEKNFTGMGVIAFAPEEELKLLIQLGRIREILIAENQQKTRLTGEALTAPLQPLKTGQLNLIKAPGRLLSFERACFECPVQEMRQNIPGTELGKLLDSLEQREAATLVSVRWPLSQARIVVAGGRLPLRRAVWSKDNQGFEEDPDWSFLKNPTDRTCQVELYQGGLESPPWIALHLNLLFEFFCAHLFTQYSYLTGKVMVNSILKNILIYASQQDWDLTAKEGQLFDQTLFVSIEEQKLAYRTIQVLIQRQMQSFAGPNVVTLIKNQGLDRFNDFYHHLWELSGLDL